MEIPASVAHDCRVPSNFTALVEHAHEQDAALRVVISQLSLQAEKSGLSASDFQSLMFTCKEFFEMLYCDRFWMRLVGFVLPKVPENISPYLLFGKILKLRQHKDWKRQLLTNCVSEEVITQDLCVVRVAVSEEDSREFWRTHCLQLLSLSTFPTLPQVDELTRSLDIVLEKGVSLQEIVSATADLPAPSKVMMAVLANFLVDYWKAKAVKVEDERCLVSLFPRVESLFWVMMLINGITVDMLKEKKSVFTKKSAPQWMRRAMVYALANLGWLQLSDAFATEGLAKAVFKSIHIGEVVRCEIKRCKDGQEEQREGLERVLLLQALLRGCKYPVEESTFPTWQREIQAPLQRVCANPLFGIGDLRLLDTEFSQELKGASIPRPRKRNVESVLAQDGFTRETWDLLLSKRLATPAQVAANLRGLMLLAISTETIEPVLDRDISILQLMKLRQVLGAQFTTECLKHIARLKEKGEKVMLPPWPFKDKKGNVKELKRRRCVDKDFTRGTFEGYLAMLQRLIRNRARGISVAGRENNVALITHTPELCNVTRVGMPPSIPSYSNASLWRNEFVSLGQLQGVCLEKQRKLVTGISWCQTPKQGCVDLDLSLGVFDDKGVLIDQCTFDHMVGDGMQHSGDWTEAPYPEGARESVTVELDKLKPNWAILVVMVWVYSGQPLDSLEDASIFVGDPTQKGTGPGGLSIFAAARLRAQGTLNVCGFLARRFPGDGPDGPDRPTFYCTDLGTSSRNCSLNAMGSTSVYAFVEPILKAVNMPRPANLRMNTLALLYGALTSDRVCISHAGGILDVIIGDEEREDRIKFFERLERTLSELKTTDSPQLSAPFFSSSHRVTVICGELSPFEDVVGENARVIRDSKLSVVNLRSNVVEDLKVETPEGVVRHISGCDVLDLLADSKE